MRSFSLSFRWLISSFGHRFSPFELTRHYKITPPNRQIQYEIKPAYYWNEGGADKNDINRG